MFSNDNQSYAVSLDGWAIRSGRCLQQVAVVEGDQFTACSRRAVHDWYWLLVGV
jgi:hypothetical protein